MKMSDVYICPLIFSFEIFSNSKLLATKINFYKRLAKAFLSFFFSSSVTIISNGL